MCVSVKLFRQHVFGFVVTHGAAEPSGFLKMLFKEEETIKCKITKFGDIWFSPARNLKK